MTATRAIAHTRGGARAATGFTLIEVLAVILLITLVLGVALDFYVDLSNASTHATESTRNIRRATALLDRVAADFERSVLVRKPAETDPLTHPWIFLAESRNPEAGADRIKFVARRTASRRDAGPVSDFEMISYVLHPSEDGDGYELHRWSSPSLPEGLDREFPSAEDPASLLLADGIVEFGVHFMDQGGDFKDVWDSSQLIESSELPTAVEIRVSLKPPPRSLDAQPVFYQRLVLLPMPPIDLEELLNPETYAAGAGEAGEDDEDGDLTLADCVDLEMLSANAQGSMAGLSPEVIEEIERLRENADTTPFAPYRDRFGNHPAVREECR
jgi:type II secretory pathway component PulJ